MFSSIEYILFFKMFVFFSMSVTSNIIIVLYIVCSLSYICSELPFMVSFINITSIGYYAHVNQGRLFHRVY